LAEQTRAAAQDPILAILRHAGFIASFRLLSSGALPETALDGFGLSQAETAPAALDNAALRAAFAAAQISAQTYLDAPFAAEIAEMTDPNPNGSDPIVLDDADFLGLQYICGT
jgi:hypothetical protein